MTVPGMLLAALFIVGSLLKVLLNAIGAVGYLLVEADLAGMSEQLLERFMGTGFGSLGATLKEAPGSIS